MRRSCGGCVEGNISETRLAGGRALGIREELQAVLRMHELEEALAVGRRRTPESFVDELANEEPGS